MTRRVREEEDEVNFSSPLKPSFISQNQPLPFNPPPPPPAATAFPPHHHQERDGEQVSDQTQSLHPLPSSPPPSLPHHHRPPQPSSSLITAHEDRAPHDLDKEREVAVAVNQPMKEKKAFAWEVPFALTLEEIEQKVSHTPPPSLHLLSTIPPPSLHLLHHLCHIVFCPNNTN